MIIQIVDIVDGFKLNEDDWRKDAEDESADVPRDGKTIEEIDEISKQFVMNKEAV